MSSEQQKIKLTEINRSKGALPDPFAFFTGRVVQAFSDTASRLEAADLSEYIDRSKKLITSVTDQIQWDYGKGIVKIDTPNCQGVTGFLKDAGTVELKDVAIQSENEYGAVMVIALDDRPVAESEMLLIQAMTEDRLYGWKAENNVIMSLGQYPINVRNIKGTVLLKNRSDLMNTSTLDGNGYIENYTEPDRTDSGIRVRLAEAALYTVVSRERLQKSEASPDNKVTYVWWEGEKPLETNFPAHTDISEDAFEAKSHLLSGGSWLTNSGTRAAGQEEAYAKYKVDIKEKAEYNLWVRKFWQHGPFRWRFDDNEWTVCGWEVGLADSVALNNTGVCANWVDLGKVSLNKGEHVFELRLLAEEGESLLSGFDCFMLTTGFFAPRGKLKPGEKSGLADDDCWAFEPPADVFGYSPLDLRYMNEREAGENGFVRKDGLDFVLGDGSKVRFWAVNAGPGLVRQGKSYVDYLARRLAKYGVNMIRIHGSIYDRNSSDLASVDMEYLDRYHYFVAAMKKQGIYVNLSFYFPLWVNVKPEYGIPGYEAMEGARHPFALFQFDESFQNIYKEWARKLLLTINPYTGIPLAKDPAVAIIEVQNEDSYLFWTFGRNNVPEVQMEKLEKLFGGWLSSKYGSPAKAMEAWGDGSEQTGDDLSCSRIRILEIFNITSAGCGEGAKRRRMSDQLQFLVENQKGFYQKMAEFFKKDIGSSSLISASNWTTADTKTLDSLERYTYTAADVIDRHGYFEGKHKGEHAAWSVREGHEIEDRSALREPEGAIVQINQVEGYPHMITETAWPMPNRYKGEAVPMWSVYGALQGMDAIHMFALGSADWETNPISKWPIMVPSVLGQFPAFALMYRRGDVKEAATVVKVTHSLKELYDFKGSPIYETQALDELRKKK